MLPLGQCRLVTFVMGLPTVPNTNSSGIDIKCPSGPFTGYRTLLYSQFSLVGSPAVDAVAAIPLQAATLAP